MLKLNRVEVTSVFPGAIDANANSAKWNLLVTVGGATSSTSFPALRNTFRSVIRLVLIKTVKAECDANPHSKNLRASS